MYQTKQRSRAPVAIVALLLAMAGIGALIAVMPARAAVVPTVTGISPTSGAVAGGTDVLITGSGFTDATGVSFGGVSALSFSVTNDGLMTARTAASSAGFAQVQVSTSAGTSNSPIYFEYTGTQGGLPTVSGVSPSSGPLAGGIEVTISGSGFTGVTAVRFGTTNASSYVVDSNFTIRAIAPARSAGTVNVSVTTGAGTSLAATANQFTYSNDLPAVTSVAPNSGTSSGGTAVVISGVNFTGATAVTFGGVAAASFTVQNSTTINATTPANTPGTVDVRVTTSVGQSPITTADRYTFTSANSPTVTNVNPNGGPTSGGNSVVLTGTNFTNVIGVGFGGTSASTFVVNSPTQITVTAPAHGAGTINVVVTTLSGSSPAATANQYTYSGNAPSISSLSPNSGPTGGGTVVTITGANFGGATSVTFGGVGASFVVDSSTSIRATAPAHAAGAVQVVVTSAAGSSTTGSASTFTYTGGPAVTDLNPEFGPTAGGTTVVITGSGFTGATQVRFGTVNATSYVVNSNSQITAVAPAQSAQVVFVRVTTPAGTSADVSAAQYTYTNGPAVTDLNPETGSTAGGTTVVITGTGFNGATQVRFGTVNAASFTVNSNTQITAVAPAQAAQAVFVRVTTPAGTSADIAAAQYTYVGGPVITGLNPTSGPIAGGTSVIITGSGFSGATAVTFGGVNATSFTVNSSTQITAVSPSRTSAGAVAVRVTTAAGTSAEVAAGTFTYLATGQTYTYTLAFRWSLISWMGTDGIAIATALSSADNNPSTNSIAGEVTAIYRWNTVTQRWEAHFPGSEGVPGANDFNTFTKGTAYFIAIKGPGNLTWVIQIG